MPSTTTVRVFPETRDRLRRLSAASNKTAAQLLDELTSRAEEKEMLAQFNEYFEDPAAAAEYYETETRALEGTLGDGLTELT